ncbi:helix-turn-helix transcriptional regulator [Phytohabitans rumicis]|uniref:HTH luxR-type domain-containing protein n=1 Tax=Phytohabitans rumicis TaxID=1076125 RepID=A0A6V8LLF8_9ACTN|nr:LuxR family transcriptional regulator [Phytohabitans rumicis]GFJ95459.1 hypothetical protein Prum_091010 [Phytohabitans rumicis]
MQLLCPILIGRDAVVDDLVGVIASAQAGSGAMQLVLGEAGVGKTRLVEHIAGLARERGLCTMRGRAVEVELPGALRPFTEALTAAVRAYGAPTGPHFEPFRPLLAGLVPEWTGDAPPDAVPLVFVAEGILRFLRHMGDGRGALLVVEDAHWADPDSVAVLEYLADHLSGEPVAVMVTLRGDGPWATVDWAARLVASRAATPVPLRPLAPDDIRRMIRGCLGEDPPDALVEAVARRADGLPFLVEELLAGLADAGGLVATGDGWRVDGQRLRPAVPATLAVSVGRRLHSIGSTASAVIAAAAVLGTVFDWRLLAAMAGVDELAVSAALRAARDGQLVAATTDGFHFRHALSREAVLADLTPPERARLAGIGLAELTRQHGELDGETAALAANLALRAEDRHQAAEWYLYAGRRRLAAGKISDAVRALERCCALATEPRQELAGTVELLGALVLAGRNDQVFAIGNPLIDSGQSGVDDAIRARLLLLLARAAVSAADWPAAAGHLTALQGLPAIADPLVSAQVAALRAALAYGQHRFDDAISAAGEALSRAAPLDAPAIEVAAHLIVGRSRRLRDFEAAEESLRAAQRIAAGHGLPAEARIASFELAELHYIRTGDNAALRQVRDDAAQSGAFALVGLADLQLAVALAVRHRIDDALDAVARIAADAHRYRLDGLISSALVVRGFCHAVRGQTVEVSTIAAELERRTVHDREHRSYLWGYVRLVRALAADDLDAASEAAEQARQLLVDNTSHVLGMWVLLRTCSGWSADDAVRTAGLTAAMQPLCLAAVVAARAVDLGRGGAIEAALHTYGQVERILADAPWCRHVFRHLVAGAARADGWRFPPEWMAESADFFASEGLFALARAANTWLRAAGVPAPTAGPPRDRTPPALRAYTLTDRETDVALLLLGGLTNKQIAERLRLSPRTVEKYVERLFQKTAVTSRAALVALALSPPESAAP